MAYTLNDPYRLYRLVLRFNASVIGLGLGGLLFLRPQQLALWGLEDAGSLALRLGGAGLIGMGCVFLEISTRPVIPRLASVGVILSHALLGAALFGGYVGGDLAALDLTGRIVLVGLFLCCLVCVVLPFAYWAEDLTP